MKSAARSAIMMMVALVLARTMSGMTAASMTRRLLHAVDVAVLVHHGQRVGGRAHLAGHGGVAGDAGVLLEPGVQRVVGGQVGVGGRQALGQQVGEGGMLEHGDGAAHGVAEPVRTSRGSVRNRKSRWGCTSTSVEVRVSRPSL